MASVGKVRSCFLAQSSAKKLQIRPMSRARGEMKCMPNENEIVDGGIDDEAIEAQRHAQH